MVPAHDKLSFESCARYLSIISILLIYSEITEDAYDMTYRML
jgi:hypothetical protein